MSFSCWVITTTTTKKSTLKCQKMYWTLTVFLLYLYHWAMGLLQSSVFVWTLCISDFKPCCVQSLSFSNRVTEVSGTLISLSYTDQNPTNLPCMHFYTSLFINLKGVEIKWMEKYKLLKTYSSHDSCIFTDPVTKIRWVSEGRPRCVTSPLAFQRPC